MMILSTYHIINPAHAHPCLEKRAAQFSSFAALKGYEDAVNETARLTDKRINLDNDAKARLDEKLKIIQENLSNNPELTITYFNPDM